MSTKTILVTGASGFVGANLVRHLEKGDYRVHAAVREPARAWRLAGLVNTTVHSVSLTDPADVALLVSNVEPDVIYHLAAADPYSASTSEHFRMNALATAHLVDLGASGAAGAMVMAGSSSEYGIHTTALSEDTPCEPASAYGISKLAGSLYCSAVGQRGDFPTLVLRIFSAYGPYEPKHRLFPTVISSLLRGTPLSLGDPASTRDYVHVADLVEAFELAAPRAANYSGEIINLASGHSTTVRTVAETAMRELGSTVKVQWGTPGSLRPWDQASWVGTTTKAASLLGWSPRITLAQGIRSFASWLHPYLDTPEYAASSH